MNLCKHQLDFVDAPNIWRNYLLIEEDKRFNYGEKRYCVYGSFYGRAVVIIMTKCDVNLIRIISFRKANKREIRKYEQARKKAKYQALYLI